jgi:hypothetical protein
MIRLLVLLCLVVSTTVLHAQPRFSVITQSPVALSAFPGDTVSSTITIVRYDKSLESLRVLSNGFSDQWSSERLGGKIGENTDRTVVFGNNGLVSDTITIDVLFIGANTLGTVYGTMVVSDNAIPTVTVAFQGETLPRFRVEPSLTVDVTTDPGTSATARLAVIRLDPKLPSVTLRNVAGFTNDLWSIREVNPSPVTKPLSFGPSINRPDGDTILLDFTFACPSEVEPGIDSWVDAIEITDEWSHTITVDRIGRPTPSAPILVSVSATAAEVGETTTVAISTTTAMPESIKECEVDLVYNATVLAPVESSAIISDAIDNGKRTTRFRSTIDRTGALGAFDFTVLLGNAASTTVEIANLVWKDASGNTVERATEIVNGTVSVLDADGSLVNANAGPLSMTLSAPAADRSGSIVVTYTVGGSPARLMLFDGSGAAIADLSNQVSDSGGTLTVPTASLSAGVYTLMLTSASYSYVARFIVF